MNRAIRRTVAVLSGSLVVGALLVAVTAGPAGAAVFSNTAPITIPSVGTTGIASPYPSTISVAGLSGTITDVNVTLTGMSHTYSDDIDIIVVAPNGDKVRLMTDTGNGFAIAGVNLTFDQAAAGLLPDEAQIVSGTFRPTFGVTANNLDFNGPAPAPAAPYSSTLNSFNGDAPSGTWSLFVFDDQGTDVGSIASGWSLDVFSTGPIITSFAPTSGPPGT